jgi:hypothetical protein
MNAGLNARSPTALLVATSRTTAIALTRVHRRVLGARGAARTSPTSRSTSDPGLCRSHNPGGRRYRTLGCRSARSCTGSGRPRAHYRCGRDPQLSVGSRRGQREARGICRRCLLIKWDCDRVTKRKCHTASRAPHVHGYDRACSRNATYFPVSRAASLCQRRSTRPRFAALSRPHNDYLVEPTRTFDLK